MCVYQPPKSSAGIREKICSQIVVTKRNAGKQFNDKSMGSSFSIKPDLIVIARSDIAPEQRSETKLNAPEGVIPTSNLNVLWLL